MDAAVRLNPKLKLSPKYQLSAIHAITRLDLSSNDLSEVPDVIFQMQSLKILCLAQNKIETLPPPQFKRSGGVKELFYQCPALEEVQLQVSNEYIYPQVMKFFNEHTIFPQMVSSSELYPPLNKSILLSKVSVFA